MIKKILARLTELLILNRFILFKSIGFANQIPNNFTLCETKSFIVRMKERYNIINSVCVSG